MTRSLKVSTVLFVAFFLILPFIDGIGALVDITKFTELDTLVGHSGCVNSVAWSPDGSKIASGSEDKTIKIWDVATGSELKTLLGHGGNVKSVAWSPDGSKIVSGSYDSTIKIWDAASGTTLRTINGYFNDVTSVAWSSDGSKIASGGGDDIIRIWNATDGSYLEPLSNHTNWVTSVAWSPDGNRIASGSDDYTVKIWDVATDSELKTFKHGSFVKSVAWSPDGSKIVSGSYDYTIKIWDVTTGSELKTLSGHGGNVNSVAWSPDGEKIASGFDDQTIKIWDVATGSELKTFSGHGGNVNSVAWSPDGSMIASGSCDKTIKIWGTGVPNAYVSNVVVDKSNIKIGESVNITATIKNNGTADANNTEVDFYDGSLILGKTTVKVVRDGENVSTYKWMTNSSIPSGVHTIIVHVGTSEKSVTVTIIGVPNAYVRDVTVDKSNITRGESVTITATIANNGTDKANNIEVKFYDGTTYLGTRFVNITVNGINMTSQIWQTTNNTSLGAHDLRVVVETSCKNVTVQVVKDADKPNILIKNIFVNKSNINIGENVTINAIVLNNGTVDAINIEVKFYDGSRFIGNRSISISKNGMNHITYEWNTNKLTLGTHTLRVTAGSSMKETTVNIRPRIKTRVENGWLIWLVIFALGILILIIIIKQINAEKKK